MCTLIAGSSEFFKILISVLVGMFGKFLYDIIKEKIDISKEKKFILKYLEDSKKYLPIIIEEYEKIKKFINDGGQGIAEVKLFEGFDTEVLKSFSFPRYYKMFRKNAFLVFSIYNMVEKIKDNLPFDIYNDYKEKTINYHRELMKDNDEIINFLKLQQLSISLGMIDLKINEIKQIEGKIDTLLTLK